MSKRLTTTITRVPAMYSSQSSLLPSSQVTPPNSAVPRPTPVAPKKRKPMPAIVYLTEEEEDEVHRETFETPRNTEVVKRPRQLYRPIPQYGPESDGDSPYPKSGPRTPSRPKSPEIDDEMRPVFRDTLRDVRRPRIERLSSRSPSSFYELDSARRQEEDGDRNRVGDSLTIDNIRVDMTKPHTMEIPKRPWVELDCWPIYPRSIPLRDVSKVLAHELGLEKSESGLYTPFIDKKGTIILKKSDVLKYVPPKNWCNI